jgi:hypothetical protein
MNFIIYNKDGVILRTGSCPDHAFNSQVMSEDEYILEGTADSGLDSVDVITKVVIPGGRPTVPRPPETYSDIRRRMYPSTAEQLDMLWHSMDQGLTPKSEPFYSSIKLVKDSVPKETETTFIVGNA